MAIKKSSIYDIVYVLSAKWYIDRIFLNLYLKLQYAIEKKIKYIIYNSSNVNTQ